MSELTLHDVRKVADLAHLELSAAELEQYAVHMQGILDYVGMLEQVDTSDVTPLAHPIEVVNVFREDVLTEMLPRSEALQNAPQTDGKYFVVPAILDAGE